MRMTWVPESCTLPTAEQPLRIAEFDALFATATGPARRFGPTHLRVPLPAGQEDLARDLVARETACCSFFSFALRPSAGGLDLDVRVPEPQVTVLDAVQRRVDEVHGDVAGSPAE